MNEKNRKTGLFLSYLYFVLNTVMSIVISAFIVRTVGKSNHGIYQSVNSFVSYLILLEFGTGTIMTRNISLAMTDNKENVDKHISSIWFLSLFLTILIFILLVVFYFLIPFIFSGNWNAIQIAKGKQIFIFSALSLIFSFLTQTLNGVLLGYKHYSFDKILLILKLVLRIVLILIFLSLTKDVLYVVIVDFTLSFLCFLLTFIFLKSKKEFSPSIKMFDKNILKTVIPLAFALLLQTVANTANGNVDKFFIGIFMLPENVSIYSISMTIFTMFITIASIPVSIYMPKNAEDLKKYSSLELTNTLVQPCRLNIFITGLLLFGFIIVGKPFLSIVYGYEYSNSWIYAVIVMLSSFFYLYNSVIVNIVDLIGKRHVRSLFILFSTIVNIGLTIFGIKKFGMIGAAVATCISDLLNFAILNIWYEKALGIKCRSLFKQSFSGLLPCFILSSFVSISISQKISNYCLNLLICGSLFVLLFMFMFYLFGSNDIEKKKIREIIKKIIARKI